MSEISPASAQARSVETPAAAGSVEKPAAPGSSKSGKVPAIRVSNLYRAFGDINAVNDVSFEIQQGQVVGFVGANGAGKTTTMRILATLDYPTSGTAEILGVDVVDYPGEIRKILGWMPDHFGTYDYMTVIEYLDFFARALGYKGDERIERVQEVMEFTELDKLADRLINTLSKGMGQRLCLGRALIHDPEVLILDEPAAGLDPKARVELKHLIRILAEEGKTIFISSHILSELGEMCDELLFINRGKVFYQGTAEDLKKMTNEGTLIKVELDGKPEMLEQWSAMSPHVKFIDSNRLGGRIEVDSSEPDVIAGVLRKMINDSLPVVEFRKEERALEDVFIEIVGKLEREADLEEAAKLNPVKPAAAEPASKS
ncbi:MAG: ABC-2 type transport system ATP-binding protein [Verrucomicrobiales bacterium]|jgi:ABC-2 type transport system ATP-binding protein